MHALESPRALSSGLGKKKMSHFHGKIRSHTIAYAWKCEMWAWRDDGNDDIVHFWFLFFIFYFYCLNIYHRVYILFLSHKAIQYFCMQPTHSLQGAPNIVITIIARHTLRTFNFNFAPVRCLSRQLQIRGNPMVEERLCVSAAPNACPLGRGNGPS